MAGFQQTYKKALDNRKLKQRGSTAEPAEKSLDFNLALDERAEL